MDWREERWARSVLAERPDRLRHVVAVARGVARLWPEDVELQASAWLHDVGYGSVDQRTGMHAIDGALWCQAHGLPAEVTSLVAWHTGAWFEAHERGVLADLEAFAKPAEERLDALTLCDLTASPMGTEIDVPERIEEILRRYPAEHPVHRAVTRSQGELVLSCRRAMTRLGLTEGWGLTAL